MSKSYILRKLIYFYVKSFIIAVNYTFLFNARYHKPFTLHCIALSFHSILYLALNNTKLKIMQLMVFDNEALMCSNFKTFVKYVNILKWSRPVVLDLIWLMNHKTEKIHFDSPYRTTK